MKAFRCGDVVPGCLHEFVGADRDEVLARVARHAREDHGLTVDVTLLDQVEAHLHEQ